jgi:hypothetical protein
MDELNWKPPQTISRSGSEASTRAPDSKLKKQSNVPSQGLSPPPTRTLHNRFPLSQDVQSDIARLDELLQSLTKHAGEDRFTITIFDAHSEVHIRFPQHTTRYASVLVEELQNLLGKDALSVERG